MEFFKDQYLYYVVEILYSLFAVFAFIMDFKVKRLKEVQSTGANTNVERGQVTMSKLHSFYVAIAFLLVLITLNVKTTEDYKTLFVLFNVSLLSYLCFWNGWFRNKLLACIRRSSTFENY